MRGIMFNSEFGMWEAVLLGTKTNTRRCGKTLEPINKAPDKWRIMAHTGNVYKMVNITNNSLTEITARFKAGEIIYLQEPTMNTEGILSKEKQIFYRDKDHNGYADTETYIELITEAKKRGATYKNKMFMNPEDARYHIQIIRVELERLHDISPEDCLAEGLHNKNGLGARIFRLYEKDKYYKDQIGKYTRDAKASYESLFRIVSHAEAWDKNYWCFSYHFKLLSAKEYELIKLKQ